MRKPSFAMIADLLFYGVCAFVFFLCILRYFRVPLALSLTVAVLLGIAVAGIAFLPMYFRRRKKLLTKAEKERKEALLLHLALEKPGRVREALLGAYLADGKEAELDGDRLSVEGVPVIAIFSPEPVGADTVASVLRENGREPFVLACNTLTPEAERLMNSFGIKAESGEEIFGLFERTGSMPEKPICGEIARNTTKRKLHRTFSKSNARPFFVSGILLLLMSLFTFFPIYYIISGSILLFCAIAVRLFGYAE